VTKRQLNRGKKRKRKILKEEKVRRGKGRQWEGGIEEKAAVTVKTVYFLLSCFY
jgi:hypothetical protein